MTPRRHSRIVTALCVVALLALLVAGGLSLGVYAPDALSWWAE